MSGAVDPNAMTVDQAAALLHTTPEVIREHIAAGLPTVADGRVHLIQYTAWLLSLGG